MENEDEINNGQKNTQFRRLDTRVGRWLSVDPAAELYYSWSPYNLSINNPVINSDPSGATVVIPNLDHWSGKNQTLETNINELIEDSPAFATMYHALNNMQAELPIQVATTAKDRRKLLDASAGGYFMPYNATSGKRAHILLGTSSKETIVEEVAHAYQSYIDGGFIQQEVQLLAKQIKNDPTLKSKNLELINELNQSDIAKSALGNVGARAKRPSGNGNVYLEVEAKLIRRLVLNEAHDNRNMRNGWGGDLLNSEQSSSTSGSIFKSFIQTNFKDGYKTISTPSEINSFYQFQIEFQNSWKLEKWAPDTYKKGAYEVPPDAYNSLAN